MLDQSIENFVAVIKASMDHAQVSLSKIDEDLNWCKRRVELLKEHFDNMGKIMAPPDSCKSHEHLKGLAVHDHCDGGQDGNDNGQ